MEQWEKSNSGVDRDGSRRRSRRRSSPLRGRDRDEVASQTQQAHTRLVTIPSWLMKLTTFCKIRVRNQTPGLPPPGGEETLTVTAHDVRGGSNVSTPGQQWDQAPSEDVSLKPVLIRGPLFSPTCVLVLVPKGPRSISPTLTLICAPPPPCPHWNCVCRSQLSLLQVPPDV